jgi:hypothetical protein
MGLNGKPNHDHAAIVQKLYAEIEWPPSWRAAHGDKEGQRKRIGEIVTGVLAAATTSCPSPRIKLERPARARGDAWTAGGTAKGPTANQTRNYNDVKDCPPPTPDPFTEPPTLHFGAHLWPIRGYWQRHADAWNKLASMITGKCVVIVVTDDTTSPVEEVRAALDPRIEIVTAGNTPHGENPSFTLLQQIMPRGQNDIFLYAHGKGVRERTFNSKAIDLWIDWMYESVIFSHDRVIKHMNAGYKMVGSFRMFGLAQTDPQRGWHYAGTFFAVRAKYLPGTRVQDRYGGVENWPGQNFNASECYCEFMDNVAMRTLYLDSFMQNQKPFFDDWKKKYAP